MSNKSKQSADSGSDGSEEESDTGRASRISKYSKYSKLSNNKSKNNSEDKDEYYSDEDDVSLKSAAKSRGSSKTSSVYAASRKSSGARPVADSKDTKVNTPVELRAASQVSDNDSEEYYSDEYSYDTDKKKSAVSRKK